MCKNDMIYVLQAEIIPVFLVTCHPHKYPINGSGHMFLVCTLGKHGVMPWGLAQGSLENTFFFVSSPSAFAEALLKQ